MSLCLHIKEAGSATQGQPQLCHGPTSLRKNGIGLWAQAQPLVITGNNEWGHYHMGQTGWANCETISASPDSELQRPWGAISSEW